MIRNKWMVLFINVTIAGIVFWLKAPVYNLFHFINSVFYVGSFYFFIGLVLLVIRGKFFDGITYSFRRFIHKSSKNPDYLDDWEDKPLPSEKIHAEFMKFFLFQGAVLMAIMVFLLLAYYTF